MVLLVVQYDKNEIVRRTREEVVIVEEPAIVSLGVRWWKGREVFGLGLKWPRRMCNHQKTGHHENKFVALSFSSKSNGHYAATGFRLSC